MLIAHSDSIDILAYERYKIPRHNFIGWVVFQNRIFAFTIGSEVAQFAEHVTHGQEAVGSILLIGGVVVSIIWLAETEVMVSLLCLCVAACKIIRRQYWDPFAR